MKHLGFLVTAVAIVFLLPATIGAQERAGGRVFDVDPNPAPRLQAAPQETPQAAPDSGQRRFDAPSEGVPGPALPFELLRDGSFEDGTPNPNWTEASTNFGSPLCTIGLCGTGTGTGPHSGDWWAWFGGIAAAETASVEQDVLGDPNQVCTLSFWLEIPAASGNGTDFMNVLLGGQPIFSVLENAPGYATYSEVRLDVSDVVDGMSQALRFESTISGLPAITNFFVDDVSLGCEPYPIFPPPGIFSGTGAFGGSVVNPAYTVNEYVGFARGLFAGIPVWGAGYVESNRTTFFTSSSIDGTDVDGSQMMIFTGGLPLPFCTLTTGGNPLRVDGLAFDPPTGNFFMVHQFADAAGAAGIFAGPDCSNIVPVVPLPDGAVSGIAYDAVSMTLYGADDPSGQIVSINTTTGTLTPIVAYPAGATDIDGLAFGEGKLYLVPDGPGQGGVIFVYDVGTATFLDPLPAPWMNTDVFSGAAFIPGSIWGDGFESGDFMSWSTWRP